MKAKMILTGLTAFVLTIASVTNAGAHPGWRSGYYRPHARVVIAAPPIPIPRVAIVAGGGGCYGGGYGRGYGYGGYYRHNHYRERCGGGGYGGYHRGSHGGYNNNGGYYRDNQGYDNNGYGGGNGGYRSNRR